MYVTSEARIPIKLFFYIKGAIHADWVKRIIIIKLDIALYNICSGVYDTLV